jgi:putative colanic acid biosynthesis acetyltransferase WcaF
MPDDDVPVIDLSRAPGARQSWDRPVWSIYAWALCERLFVTSSVQVSSRLRVAVLRAFGAEIGDGVILRPGLRVKFPWKLHIGDRSWIGESVWLHNQDHVFIGHDAVVSQDTFLTTGTHAFRGDMGLRTEPVRIGDGAWVTSRCVVLGGADIGTSALILPNTVVRGVVEENTIVGTPSGVFVGRRFRSGEPRSEVPPGQR